MCKTVAVIACLDTKGKEVEFTRDVIVQQGVRALLIDIGVYGEPLIRPDIAREQICEAAGLDWDFVSQEDKKARLQAMAQGVAVLVPKLYESEEIDAVLSIGGGANTAIGTVAMQALPLGVPKLMVSTIASGRRIFDPFVGTKDIMLMHSVADLSGLNSVTKAILQNAAAAMVGMVDTGCSRSAQKIGQATIGATMLGVTTQGVERAAAILSGHGYDVVSFHATGVGGRALEELIRAGRIQATLDLTIHEITSEFFGTGYSYGALGRLEAASAMAIPQVVAPGGIDVVDYAIEDLPIGWQDRKHIYQHPTVLHLKLHKDEIRKVAKVVATRLNNSKGPVTLVIPLRGFHQASYPEGPLWDKDVDQAFLDTLSSTIKPFIKWVEIDAHINEPEFSMLAAKSMMELIS